MSRRVLVVGAGAAGVFAAIQAAEAGAAVTIWEVGGKPLHKVRISGGGRCNVSTAVTDPRQLVTHYPRGAKELRGPFRAFGPAECQAWFEDRGVPLKTEADGRVFPQSDDSASIADCLLGSAERAGVRLQLQRPVQSIAAEGDGFSVQSPAETLAVDRVILATGGGKPGHRLAESLGHRIVPPVPSLFTFTVPAKWLTALAGVSVPQAQLRVTGLSEALASEGPLLVTHWGLSGPAVLRASAWGARLLHAVDYRAELAIDWTGAGAEPFRAGAAAARRQHGKQQIAKHPLGGLPKRLWRALVERAQLPVERTWAGLTKAELVALTTQVTACPVPLRGKGVFKEEFVTAGGVDRRELDWRRMESRIQPGLHCVGELVDVDGITGGFNFSAAWATGWLAGRASAAP